MLTDSEFRLFGETKSSYPVLFLKDSQGEKFALKVFPRGINKNKADNDFNHESDMNI